MSDYPYRYGQYPASQPHAPYAHPHAPAHPSAPPNPQMPYFGALQQGGVPANNYAAINNSFEYNANRIPGLGLGGSSVPPTSYPTENTTLWHPQPHTSRPNTLPPQIQQQASAVPIPSEAHGERPAVGGVAQTRPQEPANSALEEGELSEGEFGDLYEPQGPSVIMAPTANQSIRPSTIPENLLGSVGDADGSSIYDAGSPQGEAVVNSTSTSLPTADQEYSPDDDWEPTYPEREERERSGSYSPYLSPREIQRKVSVTKVTHREANLPESQPPVPSSSQTRPLSAQHPSPSPLTNGGSRPISTTSDTATGPSGSAKGSATESKLRSVAEAKKRAQEAILGLWPLKVRYQDYIDEGVDEKVVKHLFTDLGLDASVPKPSMNPHKAPDDFQVISESTATASNQPASQKNKNDTASIPQSPKLTTTKVTSSTDNLADVKMAERTAAEERKDKIARRLAAKAQKPATTTLPQPSAPAAPSQPAQGASNPPKPANAAPIKVKTRAENNAILHQKLAALKKAQGFKRSATSNGHTHITPDTDALVASATVPPESHDHGEPTSNSAAVALTAQKSNHVAAPTESRGTSRDRSIPGLFLTSTQLGQGSTLNRNLKRPVASDFDSYPTQEGTIKRTRTQETLIIDVSDDEDVEMDIGSPADESPSMEIINPSARKTPLGAFPPLSNTPNHRQRSSPVSTTIGTPPVGGAKLNILHKRIEETKRMIAEAEAKKAAKRANFSESPQPQSPAGMESARLPKVGEAKNIPTRLSTERRDRIASYELPQVDATLKERQEKLKQIIAQAAQLELDVRASLDERQKLTAEMEGLVEVPEKGSPDLNGQSPPVTSAAPYVTEISDLVNEPQSSDSHLTAATQDPTLPTTGQVDVANADTEVLPIANGASLDVSGSNSPTQYETAAADPEKTHISSQVDMQSQGAATNVNTPAEQIPQQQLVQGDGNTPDTTEVSKDSAERTDSVEEDISMQTSAAELSPSDDSYEQKTAQISNASDTRMNDAENREVRARLFKPWSIALIEGQAVDTNPDEANPTVASYESVQPALHEPTGEVQDCSSQEHPLLTNLQDEEGHIPPMEDLLSYHSPLGYFRAYRFHPKYFEEVLGGLKSMTYSSRIDPMRPLCPKALAGEQCPDGSTCKFQHFENMVLPDGDIITQLGSADMYTGETRVRFIDGLKRVLNELKANKVKDFDRITKAIVKHRQDFQDDKTKVLPLDAGTS